MKSGPALKTPLVKDFPDRQANLAIKYRKGIRFKGGTTVNVGFDKQVKVEYVNLKAHHKQNPNEIGLSGYEEWRDRTVAAINELLRAGALRRNDLLNHHFNNRHRAEVVTNQ